MPQRSPQLYAITGETSGHRTGTELRQRLLDLVAGWSHGGVDFIQLREKALDSLQLQVLTRDLAANMDRNRSKLLVNIPTPQSATWLLAANADGVHLAGKPVPGAGDRVRQAFGSTGRNPIISLPCHSLEDIEVARQERADLIVFSPIFEKPSDPRRTPQGLEALGQACAAAQGIPVFALGGVNRANAADCLAAGATGVAGIRLFDSDDWRHLRAHSTVQGL